jgi:hypothetical protein
VLLSDTIHRLMADLPEGGRGLVVGHSPLIEAAIYGIVGAIVEPLKECEGVVLVGDQGDIRLDEEFRLT